LEPPAWCDPLPLTWPGALWALCYPEPHRAPRGLCGLRAEALRSAGVAGLCQAPRGPRLPGGLRVLGKGHAGVVALAYTRWGPAAVKVLRLDSRRASLEREAALQAAAARAGAAPEPLAWGGWFIVSRYIPGPTLGSLGSPPPGWAVVAAVEAARALDAAGVEHYELHRPWRSVLYTSTRGGPVAVVVDYESAGRGCGSLVRLVAGLAARVPGLRAAAVGGRLRPLLREYKLGGCPHHLYREIHASVAAAVGVETGWEDAG